MSGEHTPRENGSTPGVNQECVTSGPFRDGPSSFSQRVVDKRFPIVGRVPTSEAPEGAQGPGPRAFGNIGADARGPLHPVMERIGLLVIGALFVVGAVAIGLAIAVVSMAAFVVFLTFDLLWTLRTMIIGLAFAFVIAKTVGLL